MAVQLPVEIVLECMNAVGHSTDSRTAAKTYYTCAFINRAWHGAAIRFLWYDIHLASPAHADECLRNIQKYPRNTHFTRSLTFNGGTPLRDPTKPEIAHAYVSIPHVLSTLFPNLQSLTVDNATIAATTLASFFATSQSITSLSIYHWTGTFDETSTSTTALQSGISRLSTLTAGAPAGTPCHIYNDDEKSLLTYLTTHTSSHLRSFSFASHYKTYLDNCIKPLAENGGASNLESITLERSATDSSILPIINASTCLKSINLNGTRATDLTVSALVDSCPDLQSLHLGYTYITDSAITSLSSQDAPELSSLDLTNTYVTEDAFVEYLKVKGKELRKVGLKENRWVTEKTLRAIEEHAGGVEVLEVDEMVWMGLCAGGEGDK
ncbi:hypothetical protein HDV00_011743 [Rhizophlyctis rosea]|nr:hypothetical protein HDV00_011743 [Rhizophlyctis rosea]